MNTPITASGLPLMTRISTAFTRRFLLGAGLALAALGPMASAQSETGAGAKISPFGIGGDSQTMRYPDKWMPQMVKAGIRVARTCRTEWPSVEPKQGEWSWTELDGQMAYMAELGIAHGGMLVWSPKWNAKDKPGSLPVNNIEGWSKYVTEVVTHCKGKVKYWEVWNEPPNFIGKDQTPADYAKIVMASYKAAKAADPDCMVGLAAKSAHVNYLEKVIQAGAKGHYDYITLHPYEILGSVLNNAGTESVYMNILPTLRKMLAVQDPDKVNVPVWFTELGTEATRGADVQAHTLVKAYTMGIAQGVECINWFEGMDGDSGPMGLLDRKQVPRPAYAALTNLITHLGPYPKALGWVLLDDRDYAFVFQGAESTVMITWAYQGVPHKVDFGQSVKLVDSVTGALTEGSSTELTSAPVFVLGVPEKLVATAKENQSKLIPWEGNYSQAKSVSITLGAKSESKGLHTQAGDKVGADVIAYGGSARAGGVPGGSVFIVDPNFLSYNTSPIEISVVVRRNPARDNAGFKLVYESTKGFSTAGGWYTVPDDDQWHTMKWRIDDAQFVNYWGFNFSLNSDGNKFNKYFIQSATVTKLDK